MKDHYFEAPRQTNLPQGLVWQRFLHLVGKSLKLPNIKVGFSGSDLSSNGQVMVKGYGAVENKGFHYHFEQVAPEIAGRLEKAVIFATKKIQRERPFIFRRTRGVLYQLGFCS